MIGIAKGLALTVRYLFTKAVTVQYPKEKRQMTPRFRGMLKVDINRCSGCKLCPIACPDNLIEVITGVSSEGKKITNVWLVDVGRCYFCGLCVESCPHGALYMSHLYELATEFIPPLVSTQIDRIGYKHTEEFINLKQTKTFSYKKRSATGKISTRKSSGGKRRVV